jgi:hypothetical protein
MKKISTEIKWALIFVAMSLSWMVFEKLAGFHDVNIDKHPVVTNFIAIPAIAVYVLALFSKRRRDYNGFMSYKQGFISGLIITAIVTILSPIAQVITSLLITPDYFNNAIEYTVSQGLKSREEAEKYFSLGNYIIQGLIGAPIMGTITTAIVAIFMIKKPKAAL